MARKISEIYQQIVTTYANNAAVVGVTVIPDNWGLVNRRRIWAMAQAFAVWVLEVFLDEHVAQINETISLMKPGTARWYVEMAKKFQYGHSLVPGTDYYDNTGFSDAEIASSRIVKFAACPEEPFIRLKVATLDVDGNLAKLSPDQLTAFVAYIRQIRYAGVKLNVNTITSTDPDDLKLALNVVFDPLVLDDNGARRDGTDPTPVQNAVKAYLQNIDFNGVFDIQKLQDAIQKVDGVISFVPTTIQWKYGALPFTSVGIRFNPDSGYFIIKAENFSANYTGA